eukprot:3194834-Prymnesium_polylepis.1
MLSSARHRAGRFDVRKLSSSTAVERLLWPPRSEFLRTGRGSSLLRVESFPAMDGCAGDPTLT